MAAGSTKRFGARYGRRVKERFGQVEAARKEKQQCPFCHKTGVKRLAAGIWFCPKCESKFAGAAYTVTRRALTRAAGEVEEEKEVAKEAVGGGEAKTEVKAEKVEVKNG